MSSSSIISATHTLQSDVPTVEEKLQALRNLKRIIENDKEHMDIYTKRGLSQLILDNVLKIIMREDRVVNPFVKQLIRVELYSLLTQLLESQALFGSDVISNLHKLARPEPSEAGSDISSEVSEVQSLHSQDLRIPDKSKSKKVWRPSATNALSPSKSALSLTDGSASVTDHNASTLWGRRKKLRRGESNMSMTSADTSNLQTSHHLIVSDYLKEQQDKVKKYVVRKSWRPRPAVLFNERIEEESVVPGVDPTNFLEQDRKLGYQKPRMWFPVPKLSMSSSLVKPKRIDSNPVVEQYLNMKSLASYVGDLVVPYSGAGNASLNQMSSLSRSYAPNVSVNSSTGSALVDAKRYPNALKEAMTLWGPILDSHVPKQQAKKKRYSQIKDADFESEEDPSKKNATLQRVFYEESVTGMDEIDLLLDDKEETKRRDKSFRKRIKRGDDITKLTELYQRQMSSQLASKGKAIADSISSLQSQITSTMQAYYQSFHPKYLLLIEGRHARSRQLIRNMMKIFLRVKRRSQLTLAFGMMKIAIVKAQSQARLPYYAKMASCNLITNWVTTQKKRNDKRWLEKWKESVRWIIFIERNKATALIQTLYRRWRDRRKFVQMHKVSPYLGLLSDIALAPHRPTVKHSIPRNIRDERRLYWIAATMVQSLFRCWIECKDFFEKKRRIVLLQSICRMWPKYIWFQRLKATTIKCQAWARRTVKRRYFLVLRRATIIVQKYVRRYQAIMRKLRMLQTIWENIEKRLAASIKIQCRYRIRLAKARIKKRKFNVAMRQYAVLVIQRNWYRSKNAFHTFFLMCALREREEQDIALEKLATTMGRCYRARRIQRLYKARYHKRIITNVIKVQCWFRGRLGYNLVDILRRERWASRKLRHWVRARLRFRHRMVRKIQRWWWKQKQMRLLKHLWYKQRCRDRDELWATAEAKHTAASRIQAYVKGIWDRRWVRRHRAVLLIQKNWKFFNGLRKWKQMKRGRILYGVTKVVGKLIDRAVTKRVNQLVALHSKMLIKPQALMRGFLVRSLMLRARSYATKLALAAVKVQRFWRQSGAMTKAVEEVMARKRMEMNPFKLCGSLHDVLIVLRQQCQDLYSSVDPRIGLKMSSFLYRMGYSELEIYFPRRGFNNAVDAKALTVKKLTEWYDAYQAKEREKERLAALKNNVTVPPKRTKPAPLAAFQSLVAVLRVPLYPRVAKHKQKLQVIQAFPDFASPYEAFVQVRKLFLKKFGRNLQTRAANFAKEIIETVYPTFNCHHAFGDKVLTVAHIQKAISMPQDSSQVMKALEEVRSSKANPMEEKKHDVERLRAASNMLQLAFDRAIDILPDGKMKIMMEKAVSRVASYKRKVGYLLAKSKKAQILNRIKAEKAAGISNATHTGAKTATVVEPAKTNSSAVVAKTTENADPAANAENPELNITPLIPVSRMEYHIKAADAVDFTFHGLDEDFEFEYLATICKVYMSLAEELLTASLGVQSIKNSWNNKAVRRAMVTERRQQFMAKVTNDYLQEQNEDHVRAVWMRFRVLETRKQRLLSIMNAVQKRKADIEYLLSFVPRYHVYTQYDDYGYVYYVDDSGNASYEMPTYTFKQYLACQKIQTRARLYIEGARQRRLHKEMLERLAIEEAERKLEEERKKALKAVELSINYSLERFKLKNNKPVFPVVSQILNKHYNKNKKNYNMYRFVQSEEDLEKELPWKLQFSHIVSLKKGVWALLYTAGNSVPHNNFNSQHQYVPSVQCLTCSGVTDGYEIILIVKMDSTTNTACDVRTVKGQILRGVPTKRIIHMNYDIHTQVECRYRYRKLFYRGEVTYLSTDNLTLEDVYKITYEDGEVEDKMGRDAIRPTRAALETFLASRQAQLQELRVYLRRLAFYHSQMLDRQTAAIASEVDRLQHAKALGDGRAENAGTAPLDQSSYAGDGDTTAGDDNTYNEQSVDENELNEVKASDTADKERVAEGGRGEAENQLVPYEERIELPAVESEIPVAEAASVEAAGKNKKKNSAPPSTKEKETSRTSDRRSTKASIPTSVGLARKKLISRVIIGSSKVKINITKAVLQFNWSVVPVETRPVTGFVDSASNALVLYDTDPKTIRFLHAASSEELIGLDEAPYYTAREIYLIRKIQLRWKLFKAVKLYTYRALNFSLESMVKEVIGKGSKIAFVGYKMEGVTVLETLVRAGFADVAQAVQDQYHQARKPLASLTIDELISVSKDDYEKYGIVQAHHVREMKDFQLLYKKLSPVDREKKFALFNYYSDPYDTRGIQDCIKASMDTLMRKFTKVVKTGQSRTKQSLQNLVDMSNYPHSHQQVESYLKKYSDKPELIRDCVMELANRPIIPTYVEESKVFKLYYHTAIRISSILHIMKLKNIRLAVLDIIRRAENTVGPKNFVYSYFEDAKQDAKAERQMCSGPEAKGAWMIRQDIFEYLLSLITSAKIVQRNVRTFLLRKKFVLYMSSRIYATGILQRNIRRFLAYRKAAWLRRQLYSLWEQLWDNRYHRLYYYNVETHYSQYDEPPDRIYRPLIREKLSAALMQAWPHLRDAASNASAPVLSAMEAADASKYLLCNVCNQRACVKYCLDCHQEGQSQHILHEDTKEYMVSRPVTYCLPCFIHEHPESNEEKAKHRSHIFEDAPSTAATTGFDMVEHAYLKCCMCAEPATRKCQGPLDDEQIDLICRQLQRTPIDQWKKVLQDENVGGERKVMSILDQMMMAEETPKESVSPGAVLVAPNQLNAMRAALERLRAECDESYCKSCYKQVHSGGKRVNHRWVSFQERSQVCVVCTSTPAVFNCIECSTDYCDGCFKVFHNMGKKRRHKKEVIKEELERNQSYCFICTRRAGNKCAFERCNKIVCECCFEFKHKDKCSFNKLATPLFGSRSRSPSPSRRSISSPQTDIFSKKETKCVVCGEEADKRCMQCGDLYCSIVYMGNAGCFAKFHSKGNRASHTTESLVEMQLNSVRMSLKQKFAQEKGIKHKLGY